MSEESFLAAASRAATASISAGLIAPIMRCSVGGVASTLGPRAVAGVAAAARRWPEARPCELRLF